MRKPCIIPRLLLRLVPALLGLLRLVPGLLGLLIPGWLLSLTIPVRLLWLLIPLLLLVRLVPYRRSLIPLLLVWLVPWLGRRLLGWWHWCAPVGWLTPLRGTLLDI